MDSKGDDTPSWTPYRYGFDNPLRMVDPDGRTEKERIAMVKAAGGLLGTRRDTEMKGYGLVGNRLMDCGVVLRISALKAGLEDPGLGEKFIANDNSVGRIAANGRESSVAEAQPGFAVAFNTGEKDFGHVGIVTKILSTDRDGNVTDFRFTHCTGSKKNPGEVKTNTLAEVTGWKRGAFKVNGVFQLDHPEIVLPEVVATPKVDRLEPLGLNSIRSK